MVKDTQWNLQQWRADVMKIKNVKEASDSTGTVLHEDEFAVEKELWGSDLDQGQTTDVSVFALCGCGKMSWTTTIPSKSFLPISKVHEWAHEKSPQRTKFQQQLQY